MNKVTLTCVSVLLLIAGCGSYQASEQEAASSQTPASTYAIEHLTGDLYRASSGNHHTVFLVTSEGVILGDPLNLRFAEWLKAQLAERFDSEVKYVLYSHHHWDHASGAAAFADTALLVGHQNMIPGLALPLPANYVRLDQNGDGAVQQEEAAGGLRANFVLVDENGDGKVTGAEMNRDIVAPSITYSDRFTVSLGGSEVQVHYTGTHHSNDGSVLYFPEEKVVHGVDFVSVARFPVGFGGTEFTPWTDAIDLMLGLDFETLVPGHGEMGDRDDLLEYRTYFDHLRLSVSVRAHAGMSVEDIQQDIDMDAYSHWVGFDTATMHANTAEIYQRIVED